MCKLLGVTRSLVYYKPKARKVDTVAENAVIEEFRASRGVYGTRKLKHAIKRRKLPLRLSRRKIGNIMEKYGLVSKYIRKRKNSRKKQVNEDENPNIIKREFGNRDILEVVVSDLTYVRVNNKWHYICLLIDLAAREIIGHAAGRSKDAKLVRTAFYRIKADIRKIHIFHTDRGSEFKNEIIDEIIAAFGIDRSLSAKGAPIDNAVAESMYNILKTEFIFDETFDDLDDLELKLFDYVNWYNNVRLHGELGYLTPIEYKAQLQKAQLRPL
jgi:transposase InsO family protein